MTQNVVLAASFTASAGELFDMYLDARCHAEITGSPVTIASQPASPFSAFDGMLSGSVLQVVHKRLIVQSWRSKNWPATALDSTLVLSFWPQGDGARIELVHVNVPEEDFASVSEGWNKYYWAPWRAYLAKRATS